MLSFLQHLIDTGWQLQAVPIESGWLEVDSVDDLESYSNMLNEKSLNPLYFSPLLEQTV